ncbi:MAG: hypothetical protein ACXWB9_07465, partial [Flavisolibacter sp.]
APAALLFICTFQQTWSRSQKWNKKALAENINSFYQSSKSKKVWKVPNLFAFIAGKLSSPNTKN